MLYQKFGQLMGESARLWKAKLNQKLKPLGLSYAKWSTLLLIDRLGSNLLLNEIAEALSIEHPTLTRVLKELERDDWIIRQSHPDDKRAKTVSLSKNAKEKMANIEAIIEQIRAQILDDIDQSEIEAGAKLLEKISSRLKEL